MPNNNTVLTPPHAARIACPPKAELQGLIHGDLSPERLAELTEHIGECVGCQERIDTLSSGEVPELPRVVRNIDRYDPPKASALWKAIDNVVTEVTKTSTIKALTDSGGDQDLNFLTSTKLPGRIGLMGQFEIIRMVGRGGMGVVLHGFDPSLERDVAIKVLDPILSNNKTARQRFCREARAAAAVAHENIVAVYSVNEDDASNLPFLVMQLVNGESLEQRLRRVNKLSVLDAVRVGAQAAAGLAAAHATGLIHRDIKPGNILIESGDKVKLTDFGLARLTEDLKLTKTGFVSGTPLYMAPEQARGDDIDPRADLFSLGVVLYECLAGKPPFEGKTPLAVLRQVADTPHTSLRKINADVPEWLEDVIDSLLTKTVDERIPSAAVLAEILSAHVGPNGSGTCEELDSPPCPMLPGKALSHPARKRYRRKLAALTAIPFVAGLALGVIGFWAISGGRPNPAPVSLAQSQPNSTPVPDPGLDLAKMNFPSKTSGAVLSTAISPDGKTLVVGLEDGNVRLFDVQTGEVTFTITKHTGPVWAIDFHPDGKRFATGSEDSQVWLWNLDALKEPIKNFGQGTSVRCLAFSQDGLKLAVADRGGSVELIDLKTDRREFVFDHKASVTALALSVPDAAMIATAGSDKIIRLWDVAKQTERFELPGHKGPIYSIAFSACGNHLASASWDKSVKFWDLKSGNELAERAKPDFDTRSLAYESCHGSLVCAGNDGSVTILDPMTGEQKSRFRAHKSAVQVVRFAPDGNSLFTGGREGLVKQWELK